MEILIYSKRQQPGLLHYFRVQVDYPASVLMKNFEARNKNISKKEIIWCSAHEPQLEQNIFDLPVGNGQKTWWDEGQRSEGSDQATLSSLLKHPVFGSRHPSDYDLKWKSANQIFKICPATFIPLYNNPKLKETCSQPYIRNSTFCKWLQAHKQNA